MLVSGIVAATCALALISLGGGLYEVSVVDKAWPRRFDIVQPGRGGISRRRFWIPAHVAFEVGLVVALVAAWSAPAVRIWLLLALASHVSMRLWSAFDFIPKAVAFERTEATAEEETRAVRWARQIGRASCRERV